MILYRMFTSCLNLSNLGFYLPVGIYDKLRHTPHIYKLRELDAFWFSIAGQLINNPNDGLYRELQYRLHLMMVDRIMYTREFEFPTAAEKWFLCIMLTHEQIKIRYPNDVGSFMTIERQFRLSMGEGNVVVPW